MADTSMVFDSAEYLRRTETLQSMMQRHGLSATLVTSPADVFYVTGFLTRFWESPTRPWFVIVPPSGKPVAVIPGIGAALMRRTWISDIRTWDAPDPVDDGVALVSDTIRELVPENGRVGLPMGPETSLRMPVADFRRLSDRIRPRAFADATAVLQRVREIKSEAEIRKIRATCRIADTAFDRVPEIVAQTPRLDAVFRGFQCALLEAGADWVSYLAGAAGPGGYGDVISPAEPVRLRDGDLLMLDTGAVRDGYFCDFDRNFVIGRADDAVKRAQEALFAATETALASVRPGMRAADVHRIMADALRAGGATPGGGRFGHGLGLNLTEWPSLSPKDRTELRAGMVLTLEPSVELAPGRIMVHEEDFVLRDAGAELLSRRAPAELPEIIL